MADTENRKLFDFVARCEDPDQLRNVIANAKRNSRSDLADAAFRRLISILPEESPGTVEHDLWQTVHAFEQLLSEERGRTTRLSRTRQKLARVGVVQTLSDWANDSKQTDGFRMLLERNMPELTGEAVVLRHPESFDSATVAAAAKRLTEAGIDPTGMTEGTRTVP
ncbi:MAG: hypothetical protein RLW68_08180 [Devosia marina]|uniref:hypothetical protein n=1 Tax=Devosia marina TaxID=2683198 RepID=UPI0032EF8479